MVVPSYYPRGGFIDQEQLCPKFIKWGLCLDCDERCKANRCPFIQHEWELKQKVVPAFLIDSIVCGNCNSKLDIQHFLLHLNNLRGYKEINVKTDKIHHKVYIDTCPFCRPVDGWYVGSPIPLVDDNTILNKDNQTATINQILSKTRSIAEEDFLKKEKLYRSKWVNFSDFNEKVSANLAKTNRVLEFDDPSSDISNNTSSSPQEFLEEFDPLAENIPIDMNPCAIHKQRAGSYKCDFCYKDFCRYCIINFADKHICPNCIEKKEVKLLLQKMGYLSDDFEHKYSDSHYTPDSYLNPFMVKRNGDFALPIRKVLATIIDLLLHRFFFAGIALFLWLIIRISISFENISFLKPLDNILLMPIEEIITWPFDNPAYIPISAFTLISEMIFVFLALLKYRQTIGMHIMGIIYCNDVGNHNSIGVLFLTSIFHELNILTLGLISITALWDPQYRSLQEYLLGTRTLTSWQTLFSDNPLETVYLTGKREPSWFKIKPKKLATEMDNQKLQSNQQQNFLVSDVFDADNPVTPRSN